MGNTVTVYDMLVSSGKYPTGERHINSLKDSDEDILAESAAKLTPSQRMTDLGREMNRRDNKQRH